jgi:hypothetical protein
MEVRSKDKQIHKNKHDHIQTQNMFVTVELLYGSQGKWKGKEKDSVWGDTSGWGESE